MMIDPLEFLTDSCPVCKAATGEPCIIRNGLADRPAHLARQDKVIRKAAK